VNSLLPIHWRFLWEGFGISTALTVSSVRNCSRLSQCLALALRSIITSISPNSSFISLGSEMQRYRLLSRFFLNRWCCRDSLASSTKEALQTLIPSSRPIQAVVGTWEPLTLIPGSWVICAGILPDKPRLNYKIQILDNFFSSYNSSCSAFRYRSVFNWTK